MLFIVILLVEDSLCSLCVVLVSFSSWWVASEDWEAEPICLGAGCWREQSLGVSGWRGWCPCQLPKGESGLLRDSLLDKTMVCGQLWKAHIHEVGQHIWTDWTISVVVLCICCFCVVTILVFVVVFWWPAVFAVSVCAWAVHGKPGGAESSMAAMGWEGKHPWALKATSFSFTIAACCVCTSDLLKSTKPHDLMEVKMEVLLP